MAGDIVLDNYTSRNTKMNAPQPPAFPPPPEHVDVKYPTDKVGPNPSSRRPSFFVKPRIFDTEDDLLEAADEYMLWCQDNPIQTQKHATFKGEATAYNEDRTRLPTEQGLAMHIGCSTSTIQHWKQPSNRFYVAMQRIQTAFAGVGLEEAAANTANTTIVTRLYGLREGVTIDDGRGTVGEEGLDQAVRDMPVSSVKSALAAFGLGQSLDTPNEPQRPELQRPEPSVVTPNTPAAQATPSTKELADEVLKELGYDI